PLTPPHHSLREWGEGNLWSRAFFRARAGTILTRHCLIGLVDGTGATVVAPSSLVWSQRDDAMKSTLMVTTCLLAFAFSPPAFAHYSHKEPHEKLHAQTHMSGQRAAREQVRHASASKHIASEHSERSHRIAAIHARHGLRRSTEGERVASHSQHHRWSSSRHGRFAAADNRTVREARGGESEGGSVGMASYYSASGLTAAHRTLPFGTRVRVTNLSNGSTVVIRINDRGPFIRGRSIDLSAGAARAIGMTGAGVARVRMHVI